MGILRIITRTVGCIVILTLSFFFLTEDTGFSSNALQQGREEILFVRGDTYEDYLYSHKDVQRPDDIVPVPVTEYSSSNMQLEILNDFNGLVGTSLKTQEEGYV